MKEGNAYLIAGHTFAVRDAVYVVIAPVQLSNLVSHFKSGKQFNVVLLTGIVALGRANLKSRLDHNNEPVHNVANLHTLSNGMNITERRVSIVLAAVLVAAVFVVVAAVIIGGAFLKHI